MIKFEPRDLWVGVYWDREQVPGPHYDITHVYICLIPCFPIHLTWRS